MNCFFRLFIIPGTDMTCDHDLRSGRKTEKETDQQVYERACRSDGGQCLSSENIAYDQGVYCTVQLLEQLSEKYRDREQDDLFAEISFRHQIFSCSCHEKKCITK